MANEKSFLCIKNLYKSTYKKFAFVKGKTYILDFEDKYSFIFDEEGNSFSFARNKDNTSYYLFDYFQLIT